MSKKSPTKKPVLNYHPSEECYMLFTRKSSPSLSESDITGLSVRDAQKMFGFNLLCEDLDKSVIEAEKFRKKFPKEISSWPPELDSSKGYIRDAGGLTFFVGYKVSPQIGYGVYTYAALGSGRVIAEYVGEWKSRYAFMDDTYTFISNDKKIDAKDYGNIARFFNHCPSKHPNEKVMTANVAALGWKVPKDITKVFFITLRDIKAGEPICWDYGKQYDFPEGGVQYLNANPPHKPLPLGSVKAVEHPDEF